jgi:3-oxoacyl-[acyl-carrier protein] reductase
MKRYLVIGGTGGIGLATAKILVGGNNDVIVCGRKPPRGDMAGEYRQLDVTESAKVGEILGNIVKSWPAIDGLVYSTGVTTGVKSLEDFDLEEWNRVWATNVTGALLCLKYVYPALREAKGRVVVVGSVASRIGGRLSGIEYTITKSALSGLVKHLAIQWAQEGILVNSVLPGMTRTPMLEDSVPAEVIEKIGERIPLGRIAEPAEIARAVEFLLSESNHYVTGVGLDVSGGLYLSS